VATCVVADEALVMWSSQALVKINKTIALQLPKQDFYSFKLCTVDKVHAVRPVYLRCRLYRLWKSHENICCYLVNKQNCFCTTVIRIAIVLIKTHFAALRTFDPPPETPTGF